MQYIYLFLFDPKGFLTPALIHRFFNARKSNIYFMVSPLRIGSDNGVEGLKEKKWHHVWGLFCKSSIEST